MHHSHVINPGEWWCSNEDAWKHSQSVLSSVRMLTKIQVLLNGNHNTTQMYDIVRWQCQNIKYLIFALGYERNLRKLTIKENSPSLRNLT